MNISILAITNLYLLHGFTPTQAYLKSLWFAFHRQIPFEVELTRIHSLEQLFDPSYGDSLKGTKLYDWLVPMLTQQ